MLSLMLAGIEEYAQAKTAPIEPLLEELSKETHARMKSPQMLTGPLEGHFLKMIVQIACAKKVLEIGMFTGYSALWMAEGLPDDGTLLTLEIDPKAIEIASSYFERSPHGKKIRVIPGPALKSLEGLAGPFDLIFIDADKPNYPNYYREVLPKLRSGGLILVDNVLWGGGVLRPKTEEDHILNDFNDMVLNDRRVEKVLLTIRDGLFLIRKK